MRTSIVTRSASPRFIAPILLLACVALAMPDAHANWPRWRGPQDNGSATGTYPVKWNAEQTLWKAPLPGKGFSTPIVWEQHIYLTAPIEGNDAVLAFDWSGKPLWQTQFGPENAGRHRNGSGSNPSPITDGRSIFVYFKSGRFAALDFDGKVRWQTDLVERFGRDTLYWDHGTSPVLTGKFVIMTRMHQGESWVAAFDKATGEMRWKVARNYKTPVEGDHSYATPLVVQHKGQEALLVWGAERVTLHSAADGKLIWTCDNFNPDSERNWPIVASPVVAGDVVVVPYGRADRNKPRLHGVRLADGKRLWQREDTGTFVPTPAAHNGRVYVVRDRGEVDCIEPATGRTLWTDAFPRASANFYGSPLIADGKIYAVREDGAVFVARMEDKFELLAENRMGEKLIASPVAVGNRLFIRGEQHLYCVAQ